MNTHEFVEAIRLVVRDASVGGAIATLMQPSGRRPDADTVRLSEWYRGLPPSDQACVREVAFLVSDQTTFGFLAVLDGVRAIENGPIKGRLELRHVSERGTILLNDESGPPLHDLL